MGTAMPPLCSPAHSDGGLWAVCPTRHGQGTGAVCAGGRGGHLNQVIIKRQLDIYLFKVVALQHFFKFAKIHLGFL